jgi:hypothetical protein
MRLSNLLFFFYSGGQAVPQEVEDSRTWPLKRHGQVLVEALPAVITETTRPLVSAAAYVVAGKISGITVSIGRVSVSASGFVNVRVLPKFGIAVGSVRVAASALKMISGMQIATYHGQVVVGAGAQTTGRGGLPLRLLTGHTTVVVGPDLVLEEEEDLLFLLEVA